MLHNKYANSSSSSTASMSDHYHNGGGGATGASAVCEKPVETLLSSGRIPIIDLAHSGTDRRPSRAVVQRVAAQLHKALATKGVVFLVNHGICDDLMQTAWSFLDQFCDLPADVQEAYIRTDHNNHGYIRPGRERFDGSAPLPPPTNGGGGQPQAPVELRHAFNICTLSGSRLPEEPLPGFRANVAELAGEFKALAALLLQALALGLNVEPSYFIENHGHMLSGNEDNETTLRLLYYPPVVEDDDNKCEMQRGQCQYSYQRCALDRLDLDVVGDGGKDEAAADEVDGGTVAMRCGAHCDYGTFTLLAQDSEGGLEVRLPGCETWRRVGHLPGAILLNTGEMLAQWTAMQYPALMHRVIVPPQQSIRSRGRHSMAFFCHPDNCTAVQPLPELVEEAARRAEAEAKAAGGGTVLKCARKGSFKVAKEKVATAYQMIQRKFRRTYGTAAAADQENGNGNGKSGNKSDSSN